MSLQVWLPLNKDPNMTPDITSYRVEANVTRTEDEDGWYKVTDLTHGSGGRWGIYYDFAVKPNTTYTLYVYSKSTTGVSARIGIQSFAGTATWPTVRDTNTGAEKLTTYSWTTGASDTIARVYLALMTTATKADDYVFYKEPRIYEAPQNQGVTNISAVDKGPIYNNNGKLGGCYHFDGNGNRMNINHSVAGLTSFTVCLWVKSPTSSLQGCAFCYIQNSGGMWKFATYNNYLCVRDNSRTSYDAGSRYQYSLGTFVADKWTHIACSYNAGEVKIYRDGVLLSTNHTEGTYMDDYVGTCGISDPVNTSTSGYWFNGYVNDFRTYNHALTESEVKQIAQGLVLHYPLNNNGLGGENLLKESNVAVSTTSYAMHNYYFVTGEEPIEGETYTIQIKGQLGEGKTYFGPYNSGGSVSEIALYPSSQINGIYTGTFSWRKGSASNTFLRIYHMPSSTVATSTIEWVKLEKGSTATPWCPNKTDELATTIGLNDNVVRDISGFQNNGTATGALSTSTDTVRYKIATYFNGSSYIKADWGTFSWFNFDQCTLSIWMKPTTTPSSYSGSFGIAHNSIDGYYSKCFSIGNSSGKFNVQAAKGNGWVWITPSYNIVADEWHHYAATLNGTTVKMYLDGELVHTTTIDWNTAGVASDTTVQVGIDYPGSDEIYQGYYSDARIYATALSADDIQELYEMGVSG